MRSGECRLMSRAVSLRVFVVAADGSYRDAGRPDAGGAVPAQGYRP